jgi:hypothetical protein
VCGACSEPAPVACAARQCEPLALALVEGPAESRRWRDQMEQYHYLGCRVPFGAHLLTGCAIVSGSWGCLLWTSPAWKMQARDVWIGWSDEQRRRNLQSIVNNLRFLILPWVEVKGLASKILALSASQMPQDWEARYGCRPLLLETLVDADSFRGTCYRAANWIPIVGKPPDAVAWTGSIQLTGKRSKTFTSIRWCAKRDSAYAVISSGRKIPFR